jgi:uncharacterized protein (TIGR02246 family)
VSIRFSTLFGVAVVLAFARFVEAADADKPAAPAKTPTAAEQAVQKAAHDFDDVFNSGNAEKIAGLWTVDAVYVDEDGQRYQGRDTIKKEYAGFFAANPRSKIRSIVDAVNLVNDTTAIEDGRAVIEPPPEGAPATSRYTAIYVLQEGKWLLASVHDMRVQTPSNYHRLDDFEWLIGTWEGGEGDFRIETTCRWLSNKSFIERTYRTIVAGLPSTSGTQIIGWDPELQQLCSWNFTSDSGYTKDAWKPIENGWWTQSSGVLGDGTKTTATKVFRRLDDDTLSLRTTDRTVGGVRLPDLKEVIFKRRAEKPQS